MRLSALRFPLFAHDLRGSWAGKQRIFVDLFARSFPKTGRPLFGIVRVVSRTRMRKRSARTIPYVVIPGRATREPGIHNPGMSEILLHRLWLWIPALAIARPA